MPTIMTHAIVPLAVGMALGKARIYRHVLMTGIALAMLPDADVIGLNFGIAYPDQFGHRGATHALFVALIMAGIVAFAMRPPRPALAFTFLFASMASHGLLDSLTDGARGPALLWPFSLERILAPVTPIRVSPIGSGFFSERGVSVFCSELGWVWLPALVPAYFARLVLRKSSEKTVL